METETKNPVGRPSDYTPELAAKICEQIAQGNSLRTISLQDSMPSNATIFTWLQKHPEFLEQYEKAKEQQADALAEEMLDIADDGRNDWMEKRDKDENPLGWQVNGEHVQRSRLRLDTRKWIASKLKPKKYGDKTQTELTGPNGGAIITQDNTAADIARRLAFLLTAGTEKG